MTDETIATLESAAEDCDEARASLEEALAAVDDHDGAPDKEAILRPVGQALSDWRDAQQRFMAAVASSDAPDAATAAMMLKMNHGVDATNAQRGLPGVDVEGTDKPFDVDMSGMRGTVLTNAAMEYVE